MWGRLLILRRASEPVNDHRPFGHLMRGDRPDDAPVPYHRGTDAPRLGYQAPRHRSRRNAAHPTPSTSVPRDGPRRFPHRGVLASQRRAHRHGGALDLSRGRAGGTCEETVRFSYHLVSHGPTCSHDVSRRCIRILLSSHLSNRSGALQVLGQHGDRQRSPDYVHALHEDHQR